VSALFHGQVMFTDGEFSIKAGSWSFYIVHDPCGAAVYTLTVDRIPQTVGLCSQCKKQYPIKMEGMISLLDWGSEGDRR
jgi:hypothetical protein